MRKSIVVKRFKEKGDELSTKEDQLSIGSKTSKKNYIEVHFSQRLRKKGKGSPKY